MSFKMHKIIYFFADFFGPTLPRIFRPVTRNTLIFFIWPHQVNYKYTDDKCYLSHDVASENDITPCIKIDKSLVVYRFTGNVMTSFKMLRKRRENLNIFTPKLQFLSVFMS